MTAVLPMLPDGALPPLRLLLSWVASRGQGPLQLTRVPAGNHVLPDVLRLGGVQTLEVPAAPYIRWEGAGGSRVLLHAPGAVLDDAEPVLHCGALPVAVAAAAGDSAALLSHLELARLQDASAAVGVGSGAAWEWLVAQDWSRLPPAPSLSELAAARADDQEEGLGVWNPLPLARRCLIEFPALGEPAPWSLVDDRGARHPVQLIENERGRRWLVELPLSPLAGTTLRPCEEPAPGAHWEVSPAVIDNGRVRAELDQLGQIVRLCWDGNFADLAGPACAPLDDDLPLTGAARIAVLEEGPVRARLAVRRESPRGELELIYSLHAHEDCLRVQASWTGAQPCWIDHATAQRAADLLLAGEGARWRLAQAAHAWNPPMPPTPGVRWANLADTAGKGLAIAAGRPLVICAEAGHLRVRVSRNASWALAAPQRPRGALSLGQLAEHLTIGGWPLPAGLDVPRPFRLAELGSLTPLWVSRPAGWDGELLLAEQAGARARAWLLPHADPSAGECWQVDARGRLLTPCPLSGDGDGWQLDAAPGQLLLVRWRLSRSGSA
ncbi:MAG: hypothetical protein NZ552_06500 [Planctomycetes bacterium]|nr:hypothetical protein [Planctomycetota bacterium]